MMFVSIISPRSHTSLDFNFNDDIFRGEPSTNRKVRRRPARLPTTINKKLMFRGVHLAVVHASFGVVSSHREKIILERAVPRERLGEEVSSSLVLAGNLTPQVPDQMSCLRRSCSLPYCVLLLQSSTSAIYLRPFYCLQVQGHSIDRQRQHKQHLPLNFIDNVPVMLRPCKGSPMRRRQRSFSFSPL